VGSNNGVLVGGAGFTAGKVGQSFMFDGLSQFLTVSNNPTLNPTNAITVECWMNPSGLPDEFCDIVSKDGETSERQYLLTLDGATRQIRAHISVPSGFYYFAGSSVLQTGVWNHVAMTYDGSRLKLFVNGQLDGSVAVTGPIISTSQPLRIGGGAPVGRRQYFFAGQIDDVSLYNRALSSNEIAAIYRASSEGKCALPPTVLAVTPPSWLVNEGDTVSFAATAVGSPPLRYQWQFNGADIDGATGSILTLSNVVYAQAGNYSVMVSNPAGTAASSNAVLRVNRAPIADASATLTLVIVPPVCNPPGHLEPNEHACQHHDAGEVGKREECDGHNSHDCQTAATNGIVVLDGSKSFDPDGDALRYEWLLAGDTNAFASGVVATVTLPLGTNHLTLVVNDGMATGSQMFDVEVITTTEVIDRMLELIQRDPHRGHSLLASLRAALASIDRCQPQTAINQLEAFIHKVRAEIEPVDPALAAQLIADAQAIIGVLNGGQPATPPVEITSIDHGHNGRPHLKIHGGAGRVCVVETSTDMVHWEPVGVAGACGDGEYEFDDTQVPAANARFYRVVSPR
jgi:hypothetical protein